MIFGLGCRNRLAHRVTGTEERAELQFVVQHSRWRIYRRAIGVDHDLAAWAMHGRTAQNDGRSAPVIRNRDPLIVRRERLIGAKQTADVAGVMDGREEIGVIGDIAW